MHAPTYPGAIRRSYASTYPGARISPDKVVLHTTEGASIPTYERGSMAPNLTAVPMFGTKTLMWVQHFPLDMSSRALRNLAGGVETNTDQAVQVELVGTCVAGGPGLFWPTAPEWALQELAAFLAFMRTEWGVPLVAPATWLPYPASYGSSPARMTARTWAAFRGVCGHQHVPENVHGDPGAFPITDVLARATALADVPPTPPGDNDMQLSDPIPGTDNGKGGQLTVGTVLSRLAESEQQVNRMRSDLATIKDGQARIEAALGKLVQP